MHAALELLERIAEEPQPVNRETPIVVWIRMKTLDEGYIDMHDPTWSGHAKNLANRSPWICNMLQCPRAKDAIVTVIRERYGMNIADNVYPGTSDGVKGVYVRSYATPAGSHIENFGVRR
jgi:hypothetical protein